MDRIYVMQLVRSFQVGEINRRTFLQRAGVALGSLTAANLLLAACQPVTAPGGGTPPPVVDAEATAAEPPAGELSKTDGLLVGIVSYLQRDSNEELTGYLAQPEGNGPHPAIVIIQEWWGLNEHIKELTRRFASEGFVALAPDLYKGVVATEPNEARKLVMELDMAEAVIEIESAAGYLLALENVSSEKAGLVGFCMGGRLVLMTGLAADNVGALVAFYGSPLTAAEAVMLKAPLQGHYGTNDSGISVESVNQMQSALKDAGLENEIYLYEGAQHAFFNETRAASYDPAAATAAWERTLAWLRGHLAG